MELDDIEIRPAPVGVRVAPLSRRSTREPLEVQGRFAASRAVLLKSPSSGLLEGPTYALGDVVEKGDELGTVGAAMARQRALATDAAIHQVEAQLAEREDALEAARARSESEVRVRSFEAKVRAARHKLEHERVQAKRHELLLAALAVRAPFPGRVSAVHVAPGANVMSGNPLIELVDVDPIVLVLEVPTYVASRCRPGFEVEITVAEGEEPRIGHVSRWSPTASDAVRRLLVDVDNADGRLAAGERGVARLAVGEREAWFAPRAALCHEQKAVNLQLVEHNKVLVRRVRTFGGDDREVEVAGALLGSQLVVLHADRPLKDSTEVVILGDH